MKSSLYFLQPQVHDGGDGGCFCAAHCANLPGSDNNRPSWRVVPTETRRRHPRRHRRAETGGNGQHRPGHAAGLPPDDRGPFFRGSASGDWKLTIGSAGFDPIALSVSGVRLQVPRRVSRSVDRRERTEQAGSWPASRPAALDATDPRRGPAREGRYRPGIAAYRDIKDASTGAFVAG